MVLLHSVASECLLFHDAIIIADCGHFPQWRNPQLPWQPVAYVTSVGGPYWLRPHSAVALFGSKFEIHRLSSLASTLAIYAVWHYTTLYRSCHVSTHIPYICACTPVPHVIVFKLFIYHIYSTLWHILTYPIYSMVYSTYIRIYVLGMHANRDKSPMHCTNTNQRQKQLQKTQYR